MSSITNFALSIMDAHWVSAEEFGRFAFVFWTYLVLLNVGRAFPAFPSLRGAIRVLGAGDAGGGAVRQRKL
jgi:hypothetical protein